MLNWGSLTTPEARDSAASSPGAHRNPAADCRPLLYGRGPCNKGHRIKLPSLVHNLFSCLFGFDQILFLNFIIKLPNWPQISSNSVMLWPWAGSNEAVWNSPRQQTLKLSKGSDERSAVKECVVAPCGRQGCPSMCWEDFSKNWEATLCWAADFRKRTVLPPPHSPPLPQSQISICPHSLHSKSLRPAYRCKSA